jgi:hypothetical protein
MSDKMVEEMARAIEPRAWEAFDGYVEVFAGALKGYTAEQKREAFIYGSPLVKGHDWGRTLQHSLEAAQAVATIAERRMEEMRVEIERLKRENDRLSKAVTSGILGDLLTTDENDALVEFVKTLRAGAASPNMDREDNHATSNRG